MYHMIWVSPIRPARSESNRTLIGLPSGWYNSSGAPTHNTEPSKSRELQVMIHRIYTHVHTATTKSAASSAGYNYLKRLPYRYQSEVLLEFDPRRGGLLQLYYFQIATLMLYEYCTCMHRLFTAVVNL